MGPTATDGGFFSFSTSVKWVWASQVMGTWVAIVKALVGQRRAPLLCLAFREICGGHPSPPVSLLGLFQKKAMNLLLLTLLYWGPPFHLDSALALQVQIILLAPNWQSIPAFCILRLHCC